MAYFYENLGIINKVWYLLCSLENNYLMGIYINDIIQGELFTIKLLSFRSTLLVVLVIIEFTVF